MNYRTPLTENGYVELQEVKSNAQARKVNDMNHDNSSSHQGLYQHGITRTIDVEIV